MAPRNQRTALIH